MYYFQKTKGLQARRGIKISQINCMIIGRPRRVVDRLQGKGYGNELSHEIDINECTAVRLHLVIIILSGSIVCDFGNGSS